MSPISSNAKSHWHINKVIKIIITIIIIISSSSSSSSIIS